jgi:hypothetical protein
MIAEKHHALVSLRPNTKWSMTADGVIDWLDDTATCPSEEELQAEIIRLQAEYDAKQYQRDRAPEYPSMQEQLDMQYWDAVNGTTTWQDAINAVKAKYPKPTES